MTTILIACAITGLAAGFFAGLLGIGGGLVTVPLLAVLFAAQGHAPEIVMPLALGTSLASMIFTSVSSLYAHHARGAVDWRIVKMMVPGIALGVLLGAVLIPYVPSKALQAIFVIYAAFAAVQMLAKVQPKPACKAAGRLGTVAAGGAVGGASMLAGISGASIAIPFMLWSNVPARTAIGTAAAIGLPVALAGTVGYVAAGMLSEELPEYSIGFVHLPALAAIVIASVLSAPLGARVSQLVSLPVLKRTFAVMLLMTAGKMLMA